MVKVKRKFKILLALLKKHKKCYLCGESICVGMDLNIDHVIPKSKGGNGGDNLRPVCTECNLKKKDAVSKEYLVKAGYSEEDAEKALKEHIYWREVKFPVCCEVKREYSWCYDHRVA